MPLPIDIVHEKSSQVPKKGNSVQITVLPFFGTVLL